jgi:ribosomal protein L25 (general stress protein Ctc)
MKLVKQNGGKSIAVYAKGKEAISYRLMKEDRINFFTEADYTTQGELFSLMKTILSQMQAENALTEYQRVMKRLAGI